MQVRKGRSQDYDEDQRKRIWETYLKMRDDHSLAEIAHAVGLPQINFYQMRKTKWWKKLEEEENQNG